ncbi:MAG: hypothetical protein HPY89_07020 [Pelotomaculum sp.]|uniref:Transcriptional regulator n=1 Tax=Pelotomaculum thermopropionicum (strain DSM 13744 / JCM 10971 / SI) TaxID=370438 RepID=A5D562_PELTS|nr:hypothetical protein [Pelotomaculum sp.]BAF58627.1 transcriptional regulator [Pelotomaculum thermopropionicum SI]
MDNAGLNPEKLSLPPHSLDVLRVIGERGGMVCSGGCHNIKPGDLHCRQIGNALGIGFNTVWDRVGRLNKEGLIAREKDEGGPVRLTVTPRGREILKQAFGG